MQEYPFNMENMKFSKRKNNMLLLQEGEDLYLSLQDRNLQEIQRIQVLHISKIKKLTNFFMRGFNIPLQGKTEESMLIPEEDLKEAERKIIITGENATEKVENAMQMLTEKFNGEINRENYERTMVYLDTPDKQLQQNNRIFRLTQENNDVKATIHMDNHLAGDEKRILKFFFTKTNMSQVIHFFGEALSLEPITRAIPSKRTEYKSSFGEVAVDRVKDENADYYSIELELDKFMDDTRDSKKVDIAAQKIAAELGLKDGIIVDCGTEEIYHKLSGKDFFEVHSNQGMQK